MSLKHITTQVAECQGCVFNIGTCHLDATLYRAVSHFGACVDGIFVCRSPSWNQVTRVTCRVRSSYKVIATC